MVPNHHEVLFCLVRGVNLGLPQLCNTSILCMCGIPLGTRLIDNFKIDIMVSMLITVWSILITVWSI